jgi:O-antigen/teichoic acid export membrane protein
LIKFKSSFLKVTITLFSQFWTALLGILFMPIYIRLIGVESYGLVAFYTTLITSLSILDFGLSTSISRQLSIMKADGSTLADQRILLFSIERIYWAIALIVGAVILLLSHIIATYWINSKELPVNIIQSAVILMGITFIFQWPNSIYSGSLTGLQLQEKSAFITLSYNTLRVILLIIGLKYVSNTIICFFIIQIVMSAFQFLSYRTITWRQLELKGHRPFFSKESINKVKRFAKGVTAISLVSFALTQIDKLVVSKLVLLEFVGYYNLAFVLANIMITIISPMQIVFFPKFSALAASGEQLQLTELFQRIARLISIIVIPIGSLLLFFSHEILYLWTKNQVLSDNTAPILRYVVVGTVCNCLFLTPFLFMLAKGITRFTFYQNILATIVLTPLLFLWTSRYGALGASWVWFTVNLSYVLISIPIFHYLYFKGYLKKWYFNNLFKPVFISVPLVITCKYLLNKIDFHYTYFSFAITILILIIIYSLLTKEIREFSIGFFLRHRKTI